MNNKKWMIKRNKKHKNIIKKEKIKLQIQKTNGC